MSPAVDTTDVVEQAPTTKKSAKDLAGRSPTQIAMSRLVRDKVAVVCALVLLFLVLAAVLAGPITSALDITNNRDDPTKVGSSVLRSDTMPSVGPPYNAFTWDHPLGVQPRTGYDNLANLLWGLQTSLLVAALATVVSAVLGISLGLLAGYKKGTTDTFLSFIVDFLLAFPFILGALTLTPIIAQKFGQNADSLGQAQFYSLVGLLVLFGWMGLQRLIRSQVLSLREREFVLAARVIGVPTHQILFKELLPNLVASIVVWVSLAVPGYVVAEAGLSFLGIGLTERTSLGRIVAAATNFYSRYPLYLWAPVLTVIVLVIALNLLGDSIRDAFDPKTRR